MIHLKCGTYGIFLERCWCCRMVYCPRCRTWFRPSGGTGKEAGDAAI